MSPQGVMTHKKTSYNPGLNPIKGHKFCPGTQTRAQDKLSSLPLGITKTSPLGTMLIGCFWKNPQYMMRVFVAANTTLVDWVMGVSPSFTTICFLSWWSVLTDTCMCSLLLHNICIVVLDGDSKQWTFWLIAVTVVVPQWNAQKTEGW